MLAWAGCVYVFGGSVLMVRMHSFHISMRKRVIPRLECSGLYVMFPNVRDEISTAAMVAGEFRRAFIKRGVCSGCIPQACDVTSKN